MRFTGNGITNCYPDQVEDFISITVLSASYRSVYWRIWSPPAIEPQLDIAPARKYTVARRSGQQAMNALRASFAPYWESIQRTLFPRLEQANGSTDRKTAAVGADPGGHPYRAPDSPVLPGAGAAAQGPRGDGAGLRGQRSTTCRRRAHCWTGWPPMWPCAGSAAGSGSSRCRASRSSRAPLPSSPTRSCPSACTKR